LVPLGPQISCLPKHNYILCSTFTITKVQLHVSAINVGHIQAVHEELINKLYQHVWGVYSLWGGGGARSRFVLWKGVWTGAVLGIVLKYHSCLLTAMLQLPFSLFLLFDNTTGMTHLKIILSTHLLAT